MLLGKVGLDWRHEALKPMEEALVKINQAEKLLLKALKSLAGFLQGGYLLPKIKVLPLQGLVFPPRRARIPLSG
jgi:hypothetical protein